ncbi:MAG: DNA N-6-adenine-methyltransferase [Rivularia sp. (in: cyanobacteria)]
MTMLFDIEQYHHRDSQHHKGDWDGVKYDSAWDDGSAFPQTSSKTSKETQRTNKTDCWYTPPSIVKLIIQVLGEINLDPCADDGRHIAAAEHYTKNDNGLEQPWCGKVYMNPPYSHPSVWMKKLQLEFETGNVDEAIALVPAATDTNWLSPVLKTQPVCFWKGRINVNQTSSTNGKTDIETVLPVKKTSSTKRRRRGEGTGRIHALDYY